MDGEIEIKTKIDTTGVDSGLKSIDKKLGESKKKTDKSASGIKKSFSDVKKESGNLTTSIGSLAKSFSPLGVAVGAGVKTLKEIGKVMRDTSLIYRDHENAQSMLNFAIDNSPYINGTAKKALSEYAKELEKVTELQDNEISTVMAQLVATGRTETEVRKLITASVDYASVSGESLESVATKLNATYTGMAGQLGRQHVEIKGLTEEQLKNGEAIDIIAKKYNGFAKELANADIKAANAKVTFKEALGNLFDPTMEKWDNFWNSFYAKASNIINSISKKLEDIGTQRNLPKIMEQGLSVYKDEDGNETSGFSLMNKEALSVSIPFIKKEMENKKRIVKEENEKLEAYLKTANKSQAKLAIDFHNKMLEELAEYETAYFLAVEAHGKKEREETQAKKELYEKEKEIEKQKADALKKTSSDYINESNKALEEQIRILELKAKTTGEEIDQQELWNVIQQNYIDLLTKTEGLITETDAISKERMSTMQDLRKAIDEEADAEEKRQKVLQYAIGVSESFGEVTREQLGDFELSIQEINRLKKEIESLTDEELRLAQEGEDVIYSRADLISMAIETEKQLYKNRVAEVSEIEKNELQIFKEQKQERLQLIQDINNSEVLSEKEKAKAIKQINKKQTQEEKNKFHSMVSMASGYASQTASIMQDSANLLLSIVEKRANAELDVLATKYLDGIIGEEEYNDAIIEIKKEQAQEEYKLQMIAWTASLLQATANIAEGVTKAIAQGGTLGLITGALVSAAGIVQIASLTASKPQPPQFATGGIVSGGSYTGDNVKALVNSREMVLNLGQQKKLLDIANNGGESVKLYQPITIENNSNASVSKQITESGIRFIIDQAVNSSMAQGRYNKSMSVAESKQTGVRYL